MAGETRSRGVGTGTGGTQRTQARPHPPRSPAGRGDTRDGPPWGTRCEERPSPNVYPPHTHPPPAQGSANQSGKRGGKKKIKSTMKRHNKHQLYPKKRSSKFSADERLPRSSAAPPDPHHKLGGGGRGRDFSSVLPFCASPPLRSAPLRSWPKAAAERGGGAVLSRLRLRGGGRGGMEGGRAVQGCAGLRRAVRGRGRRAEVRGCCCCPFARPGRRRDTARTPIDVYNRHTHAYTRWMKLSSLQEDSAFKP